MHAQITNSPPVRTDQPSANAAIAVRFFPPIPKPPLIPNCSVNEEVLIRLKWGQTEYKGRLVSVDSYMNIQLANTEEYIDEKSPTTLGQVLIRSVDCDGFFLELFAGLFGISHGGWVKELTDAR